MKRFVVQIKNDGGAVNFYDTDDLQLAVQEVRELQSRNPQVKYQILDTASKIRIDVERPAPLHDRNGVEIKVGQRVFVHKATVNAQGGVVRVPSEAQVVQVGEYQVVVVYLDIPDKKFSVSASTVEVITSKRYLIQGIKFDFRWDAFETDDLAEAQQFLRDRQAGGLAQFDLIDRQPLPDLPGLQQLSLAGARTALAVWSDERQLGWMPREAAGVARAAAKYIRGLLEIIEANKVQKLRYSIWNGKNMVEGHSTDNLDLALMWLKWLQDTPETPDAKYHIYDGVEGRIVAVPAPAEDGVWLPLTKWRADALEQQYAHRSDGDAHVICSLLDEWRMAITAEEFMRHEVEIAKGAYAEQRKMFEEWLTDKGYEKPETWQPSVYKWKDNSSLYSCQTAIPDYNCMMVVSHNLYNDKWVWTTTTKRSGAVFAAYHDFGEGTTAQEARQAAQASLERWQNGRS